MTHPARHSRPKDRQQVEQHALGGLLEEIGSREPAGHRRRKEHAEQRAEHAQQQQQPETTAPPMSLRQNGAWLTAPNGSAQQMARPRSREQLAAAARATCLQLLTAAASSTRSTEFNMARPGNRPPPPQLRIRSVRLYMRCRMICRECRFS